MHRFHLPPEACVGNELLLTDAEAHHAAQVLRLRLGDPIVILDGAGQQYHGEISRLDRRQVQVKVLRQVSTPRPACPVTLLQAIPKGKGLDSIIQKATELGVARIVPLLSERVVVQGSSDRWETKLHHWQQVAIEALKQSGAPWLPQLDLPVTPANFLKRQEDFELPLIASLQPGSRTPRNYFDRYRQTQGRLPRSVCVWVGPEGDFTAQEVRAAEAAGAHPITLGPLVLRVETATVYCLAVINHELQNGP